MFNLATITIDVDGRHVHARLRIPAEGHLVGVAAVDVKLRAVVNEEPYGDDLILMIEQNLEDISRRLASELRGAWTQTPLFD